MRRKSIARQAIRAKSRSAIRRVCFITGTRAEFGLMQSTLRAIAAHPSLQLQLVATGMHLDAARGDSLHSIESEGWHVDRIVNWPACAETPAETAGRSGAAMVELATVFEELKTDIVLVVGDRVEAFAAASAAHISGLIVAHVHGGDRALGQVDDALRHAITKLSHIHFAATQQSAQRIIKLGEDRWRVHRVGAPGLDGIVESLPNPSPSPGTPGEGRGEGLRANALSQPQLRQDPHPALSRSTGRGEKRGDESTGRGDERGKKSEGGQVGYSPALGRYALLSLHPVDADDQLEFRRARMILRAVRSVGFDRIVIVYPNNDPGSAGIMRFWQSIESDPRIIIRRNLPREQFLFLLKKAAVLVGNSSSGIIEAASFGTPVVDIGPRQLGRQRSENVTNVPYARLAIQRALKKIWNSGRPRRAAGRNVYGGRGTGLKIAQLLADIKFDDRTRRKLIAY